MPTCRVLEKEKLRNARRFKICLKQALTHIRLPGLGPIETEGQGHLRVVDMGAGENCHHPELEFEQIKTRMAQKRMMWASLLLPALFLSYARFLSVREVGLAGHSS